MDSQLEASHQRLVSACKTAGIDPSGAAPIRVAANAVWRLPVPGVVAKIYPSGNHREPANALACAEWLAQKGIPAVRLHRQAGFKAADGSTTLFWEDLGEHRAATGAEMGRVLRHLHTVPVPNWMGRLHDPMPNVDRHFDASHWVDPIDIAELKEYTGRVRSAWSACVDKADLVPNHGDAWPGNFAVTADGQVHMLDLETIVAAPKERDLGTLAAKTHSIGQYSPETYQDFVEAYGSDITRHSDYPIYRRVEELRACAYAAFAAVENLAARPYAQNRIDCLRGRVERPWVWPGLPVDYRKNAGSEAVSR